MVTRQHHTTGQEILSVTSPLIDSSTSLIGLLRYGFWYDLFRALFCLRFPRLDKETPLITSVYTKLSKQFLKTEVITAKKVYDNWDSRTGSPHVNGIASYEYLTQRESSEIEHQESLSVGSARPSTGTRQGIGIGRKRTRNNGEWFLLRDAIARLIFLASLLPTAATVGQQVVGDGRTKFSRTWVSLKGGSWSRMANVASDVSLPYGILFVLVLLILVVCVWMCYGINGDYNFGPERQGRFSFWIGSRHTKTDPNSKEIV